MAAANLPRHRTPRPPEATPETEKPKLPGPPNPPPPARARTYLRDDICRQNHLLPPSTYAPNPKQQAKECEPPNKKATLASISLAQILQRSLTIRTTPLKRPPETSENNANQAGVRPMKRPLDPISLVQVLRPPLSTRATPLKRAPIETREPRAHQARARPKKRPLHPISLVQILEATALNPRDAAQTPDGFNTPSAHRARPAAPSARNRG